MKRVDISFSFRLEAPLHAGSGLSRPGAADRLLQRGPQGSLFIAGEAVKGAIRMSAEEILEWMGIEHNLPAPASNPRHPLMETLFAAHGTCLFSPVSYVAPDGLSTSESLVLASTAIDSSTGRARDQSLRKVEVFPRGGLLSARVTLLLPKDASDAAITLLLASILSTEQLGAKAGIGWGHLNLTSLRVSLEGKPLPPKRLEELLSARSLEALRHERRRPVPLRLTRAPLPQKPFAWFRLELEARAPLTLGERPLVSNEIKTLEVVTPQALRGALIQSWMLEGVSSSAILLRVGGSSRYLPASRLARGAWNGGQVPIPLSWVTRKGHDGFDGDAVFDTLFRSALPKDTPLLPLKQGMMHLDSEGKPLARATPSRAIRMHVARDYRTRSKRMSVLFSQEQLSAHTSYVTHVYAPEDTRFPEEIRLGKRISAGNGLFSVRAVKLDTPPSVPSLSQKAEDTLFLELLSDALVLDEKGFAKTSLSPADWALALGIDPTHLSPASRSVSHSRVRCGWRYNWGLPSTPVTVIAAGSVARLVFRDPARLASARAARQNSPVFIGEDVHEGSGWVALDPAWLGEERFSYEAAVETPPLAAPVPWPGAEHLPTPRLEALLTLATEHASIARPASHLSELSQLARDLSTPKAVLEALKKRGGSRQRGGLKHFQETLGPVLESCSDISEVRLFLEALELLAGGEA